VYNKVLVPLDGSDLALSVLPHVMGFAKGCAAEILLLRVVAPPGDGTRALYQSLRLEMPVDPQLELVEGRTAVQHPIYREQEMASLRVEAQRCLNRAREQLGEAGLEARTEVLFGRPAKKIVDYALSEGEIPILLITAPDPAKVSQPPAVEPEH